MAVYVHFQLRRDTTANWESINPVLLAGEPGVEHINDHYEKMKFGDGTTNWNNLKYLNDDEAKQIMALIQLITGSTGAILDPVDAVADLATAYPSPATGSLVFVRNEGKYYTYNGTAWVAAANAGSGSSGVTVVDALDSTSTTSALSANQGRVLNGLVGSVNDMVSDFGLFGWNYTVNTYSAYDKPTSITLTNPNNTNETITLTLNWTTTVLNSITSASTTVTAFDGKTVTFNYDSNGKLTGRTVTSA
jgi:YD repeat-containing protein